MLGKLAIIVDFINFFEILNLKHHIVGSLSFITP